MILNQIWDVRIVHPIASCKSHVSSQRHFCWKFRTGYGPLVPDVNCQSTHCELIKDVIADIEVVRPSFAMQ